MGGKEEEARETMRKGTHAWLYVGAPGSYA